MSSQSFHLYLKLEWLSVSQFSTKKRKQIVTLVCFCLFAFYFYFSVCVIRVSVCVYVCVCVCVWVCVCVCASPNRVHQAAQRYKSEVAGWRKRLLISWLQSPSAVILEPKKIKSVISSTFSLSICHEMMGPDAMILVFLMLSFKPAFSLSTFTLIKWFFSSLSLSAIRVISSAYLRYLYIWETYRNLPNIKSETI